MISARLFRLYRLASPSANAAAKKIPEPTLRRVAASRPDVVATAAAVDRPIALSWTRYCATSADKSGDSTTTVEITIFAETEATPTEPEHSADAIRAAVEPASIDSPPVEAVLEDVPLSSETAADSATLAEESSSDPIDPVSVESATAESTDPVLSGDPPAATVVESPPPPPPSTPTSTATAGLSVHALTDRALIRVEGTDTQSLLQGLVTQDLELLNQTPAVYAMMLNLQVGGKETGLVCSL